MLYTRETASLSEDSNTAGDISMSQADVTGERPAPRRPISLGAGAVVVHEGRVLLVRNIFGVTKGRYLLPAGRVNVGEFRATYNGDVEHGGTSCKDAQTSGSDLKCCAIEGEVAQNGFKSCDVILRSNVVREMRIGSDVDSLNGKRPF